jgi:hypothetical protein
VTPLNDEPGERMPGFDRQFLKFISDNLCFSSDDGRAVQLEPMKPMLKPPGS